jgi:peptidoglycan hydrolase-like protein with peptidoglycan-binding domain
LGVFIHLPGCLLGATVTYAVGYFLGRDFIQQVIGSKWRRVEQRIGQAGIIAVATMRLLPVAPFTIVNIISGAGKIDGVMDDDARKAIRSFQQDNGMPITGMVDQRTADRLGVRLSAKGGRSQERSTSGMPGRESPQTKSGDDQNLPPSGTRR